MSHFRDPHLHQDTVDQRNTLQFPILSLALDELVIVVVMLDGVVKQLHQQSGVAFVSFASLKFSDLICEILQVDVKGD